MFLLGANEKIHSHTGFIFYNQLQSADNTVVHTGDNRTGGSKRRAKLADFGLGTTLEVIVRPGHPAWDPTPPAACWTNGILPSTTSRVRPAA